MTTVSVIRKSANVVVRNVNGVLTPSATGKVTLNNQGAVIGSGTRLDGLQDVVEGATPQDNDTLVYRQSEDKYYVQTLNLDGGNF